MSKLNIVAVSDLHGNLININEKYDVLVIAGDFSPLEIQTYYDDMISWMRFDFIPWMLSMNVEHIIFIPGNHDFVCTYKSFKKDLNEIFSHCMAHDKIHYLCNSSVNINGFKFYGIPTTEIRNSWAFANQWNADYTFDKDTDVLITHQPPRIGNAGYADLSTFGIPGKELGSSRLRDAIFKSNIIANICGHIHTGEHGGVPVMLNNNKHSCIYNTSILDEDYRVTFAPTTFEIAR